MPMRVEMRASTAVRRRATARMWSKVAQWNGRLWRVWGTVPTPGAGWAADGAAGLGVVTQGRGSMWRIFLALVFT